MATIVTFHAHPDDEVLPAREAPMPGKITLETVRQRRTSVISEESTDLLH